MDQAQIDGTYNGAFTDSPSNKVHDFNDTLVHTINSLAHLSLCFTYLAKLQLSMFAPPVLVQLNLVK